MLLCNLFQRSDVFHTETSHLICSAYQMTGVYMKCNTEIKWVISFKTSVPIIWDVLRDLVPLVQF